MSGYPHAASPRPTDVNYDEGRVPPYVLPEALTCRDGTPVRTAEEWLARRRPELLELFANEVYGRTPGQGVVAAEPVACDVQALSGLSTRLELDVRVRAHDAATSALTLRLLVWLPNRVLTPAPALLGLNLFGNQTVHPDPGIRLAAGWVANSAELGITQWAATEASRGLHARRWPVELVVSRGYALATLYAGDIDPDFHDGFRNGAHGLFRDDTDGEWPADAWGSIGAWAWGLSRALDVLSTIERIDAARVGVIGHSRLGKAALWAGAQDPRFAWVVANNSGRGGAAISRRRFGELTRHLNERFPHWFAANFRAYDDREHELPVDQHELLALIAPRPVYVASAEHDLWADPRGELAACRNATPVYELFGLRGLTGAGDDVPISGSLEDHIGYHRRPGGHDILAADWWHFLDFTDRHRGSQASSHPCVTP